MVGNFLPRFEAGSQNIGEHGKETFQTFILEIILRNF